MTILVTGASGFLGGRLAEVLARRGERVRILARKNNNLSHLDGLPIEICYGCLEDKESLIPAVENVEIIYNCAGLSVDWAPDEAFYSSNVQGVINLLQASSKVTTLKRFVHVSTSDVYGYVVEPCDETHPLIDVGLPYNRTKILGERAVWEAFEKNGLPITVVRPVTIYGPRSKEFVLEIADALKQGQMIFFDKGHSPVGILYIDNAVEGLIQSAAEKNALGQAYNLRDGTNETWRQYVNALADGMGVERPTISIPRRLGFIIGYLSEVICRVFSLRTRPLITRHAVYLMSHDQSYPIAKAQKELNFSPKVDFEQGMAQTIAWLRSN